VFFSADDLITEGGTVSLTASMQAVRDGESGDDDDDDDDAKDDGDDAKDDDDDAKDDDDEGNEFHLRLGKYLAKEIQIESTVKERRVVCK
jgi:ABC-type Zn2+ transport system substrate-binding protein/surface adhesin